MYTSIQAPHHQSPWQDVFKKYWPLPFLILALHPAFRSHSYRPVHLDSHSLWSILPVARLIVSFHASMGEKYLVMNYLIHLIRDEVLRLQLLLPDYTVLTRSYWISLLLHPLHLQTGCKRILVLSYLTSVPVQTGEAFRGTFVVAGDLNIDYLAKRDKCWEKEIFRCFSRQWRYVDCSFYSLSSRCSHRWTNKSFFLEECSSGVNFERRVYNFQLPALSSPNPYVMQLFGIPHISKLIRG